VCAAPSGDPGLAYLREEPFDVVPLSPTLPDAFGRWVLLPARTATVTPRIGRVEHAGSEAMGGRDVERSVSHPYRVADLVATVPTALARLPRCTGAEAAPGAGT
jgi:hypothetical protein